MENKHKEKQNQTGYFLVFSLGQKQFALPLDQVQRAIHAVDITIIPKAPEIVRGLVNFNGKILPVIDISTRFYLPQEELGPEHHFILIKTKSKSFALFADSVDGLKQEKMTNIIPPSNIVSGVEFLAGVMRLDNGMMLIPDLDKLLTHEEEQLLKNMMREDRKKKKYDR